MRLARRAHRAKGRLGLWHYVSRVVKGRLGVMRDNPANRLVVSREVRTVLRGMAGIREVDIGVFAPRCVEWVFSRTKEEIMAERERAARLQSRREWEYNHIRGSWVYRCLSWVAGRKGVSDDPQCQE
nr:MAG: hypothetical protein [Guiyang tombus-like virus 2]